MAVLKERPATHTEESGKQQKLAKIVRSREEDATRMSFSRFSRGGGGCHWVFVILNPLPRLTKGQRERGNESQMMDGVLANDQAESA